MRQDGGGDLLRAGLNSGMFSLGDVRGKFAFNAADAFVRIRAFALTGDNELRVRRQRVTALLLTDQAIFGKPGKGLHQIQFGTRRALYQLTRRDDLDEFGWASLG